MQLRILPDVGVKTKTKCLLSLSLLVFCNVYYIIRAVETASPWHIEYHALIARVLLENLLEFHCWISNMLISQNSKIERTWSLWRRTCNLEITINTLASNFLHVTITFKPYKPRNLCAMKLIQKVYNYCIAIPWSAS